DALVPVAGRGQSFAGLDQHRLVFGQAAEQEVRARVFAQPVPGGQQTSVLFHLLGAEQLGAERTFLGERLVRFAARLAAGWRGPASGPVEEAANVQIWSFLDGDARASRARGSKVVRDGASASRGGCPRAAAISIRCGA